MQLTTTIARENSWHLATLPLVSPPNDTWETSAEIPYCWCVTTQFWVVLLIGWIKFQRGTTNQKHYPDLGSDVSSVWNFCACFSDVIWRGNQMLAFFSGYNKECHAYLVSIVAQVRSALLASVLCVSTAFSWWPLTLLNLWIVHLPPPLSPFVFSLIISVKGACFHWHGNSWLGGRC